MVIQVTVFAVAPAQIALIRVGLAAKSLAAVALDVSCPAGRCETGSVGFEGVNQTDDCEMGRTDWEPVVVTALVAIGTVWWHQSWCFVLEVFKGQLNHLGILDAGNDLDLATAVSKDRNIDVDDALDRCIQIMARYAVRGSCHA